MLDQPNNAKNLTRLGVATPPILFQDVAAGVDRVVESVGHLGIFGSLVLCGFRSQKCKFLSGSFV